MILSDDFQTLFTDWTMKTVTRLAPNAGHRPMYGGLVFEHELGVPKTCVCGIYAYSEHISIEFTHGAALDDPMGVLEGAGKHRRHIKLRSMGDILAKDVEGYIARAFSLGEAQ